MSKFYNRLVDKKKTKNKKNWGTKEEWDRSFDLLGILGGKEDTIGCPNHQIIL